METTAISYNDLVRDNGIRKGATLATGASYTAGQIVCSNAGANYASTDILLSGVAGYNTQEIGVVLESVDATAGAKETIILVGGTVNRAKVTFPGVQTEALTNGILQAKGIILEDWSK